MSIDGFQKRFHSDPTLERLREAARLAEILSTVEIAVEIICRGHEVVVRTSVGSPRRWFTRWVHWDVIQEADENPLPRLIEEIIREATRASAPAKPARREPRTAKELFK